MGKWLRRGVIAFGLLAPLALLAFFVGMRFTGPTPAQQLALQRMQAPTPPVQGHDASDAMRLLEHDVPLPQRAQVAAAVRRYELARADARPGLVDPLREFARYTPLPEDSPCQLGDCLAYVTEHRAEVAALLDAHRPGIDAARAIADFDGFRIGVPNSLTATIPTVHTRHHLVLAGIALQFASGERLSAVQAACHDIAGWRRVGGNADHLIVSMVGAAHVRTSLELLADMLAKLPRETELPSECDAALEPSADYEFDLCPAIRYEFQIGQGVREAFEDPPPGEWSPPAWSIDWRNVEAIHAQSLAPMCAPERFDAARADRRFVPPPPPKCSDWRKRADPVGCGLAEIAPPRFEKYVDRRTDLAAMLALMRAVLWLRAEAGSVDEVQAALARRPATLGLRRAPTFDVQASRLSIPLLETARAPNFSLSVGFGVQQRAKQGFRRTRRALV